MNEFVVSICCMLTADVLMLCVSLAPHHFLFSWDVLPSSLWLHGREDAGTDCRAGIPAVAVVFSVDNTSSGAYRFPFASLNADRVALPAMQDERDLIEFCLL